MKIFIWTGNFYPSIGGVQVWAAAFAAALVAHGHEVRLITTQRADGCEDDYTFQVIRTSSPWEFWRLLYWCDVYFQNAEGFEHGKRFLLNIKYAGLLLFRRPWIITHHLNAFDEARKLTWTKRLRVMIYRMATHICVSKASGLALPLPSIVIENFYRVETFKRFPEIKKDKDILFVGRLTWYKGVDLLIQTVGLLKKKGYNYEIGIVGVGNDESYFRDLTEEEGLTDQVHFLGVKRDAELARIMNEYKIIVIPSVAIPAVSIETFGLVAVEGIACGCVAVGTDGSGLKEAIGPCGVTFPSGDMLALSCILSNLLTQPELRDDLLLHADVHLQQFETNRVVEKYLEVFEQAQIHGKFPFALKHLAPVEKRAVVE